LKQTIDELAAEFPRISSVAIVPLGLTRYNTDARLTPVTPDFCRKTIETVTPVQNNLRKRLGTTFAFLGDEIYLRAGCPIPSRAHYGEYPQIEDGIGMVRSFKNDFANLTKRLQRTGLRGARRIHGTILTGTLFAPVLNREIDHLNNRFGTRLSVIGVENNYFGGDVSVAGLLTGRDLLAAKEKIRGEFVVIPRQTLKSHEEVFLDGMMLAELRARFGILVHPNDLNSFELLLSDLPNPPLESQNTVGPKM
jgi:NifB/MoaA-like Fe-S oxidoreductase